MSIHKLNCWTLTLLCNLVIFQLSIAENKQTGAGNTASTSSNNVDKSKSQTETTAPLFSPRQLANLQAAWENGCHSRESISASISLSWNMTFDDSGLTFEHIYPNEFFRDKPNTIRIKLIDLSKLEALFEEFQKLVKKVRDNNIKTEVRVNIKSDLAAAVFVTESSFGDNGVESKLVLSGLSRGAFVSDNCSLDNRDVNNFKQLITRLPALYEKTMRDYEQTVRDKKIMEH